MTASEDVATGAPSQRISARDGNGPYSATLTVALSAPRPVTATASVIGVPGAASCAETCVRICGLPRTIVVSGSAAHGVATVRTKSLARICSR